MIVKRASFVTQSVRCRLLAGTGGEEEVGAGETEEVEEEVEEEGEEEEEEEEEVEGEGEDEEAIEEES